MADGPFAEVNFPLTTSGLPETPRSHTPRPSAHRPRNLIAKRRVIVALRGLRTPAAYVTSRVDPPPNALPRPSRTSPTTPRPRPTPSLPNFLGPPVPPRPQSAPETPRRRGRPTFRPESGDTALALTPPATCTSESGETKVQVCLVPRLRITAHRPPNPAAEQMIGFRRIKFSKRTENRTSQRPNPSSPNPGRTAPADR